MSDTQTPDPADQPAGGPGKNGNGPQNGAVAKRIETHSVDMPRRGPMASIGVPTEKALDFRGTLTRLLRFIGSDSLLALLVILLSIAGVTLAVIGPRMLGHATDVIFRGVIGANLDAGTSAAEAAERLRRAGQDELADMVIGMNVTPGVGIDFDALRRVILTVVALFAGSWCFGIVQGRVLNVVTNRVVRRMRSAIELKLHRLPLAYFDSQPRGEILSRATNDVDNIQQTMQQTLSQLLNSLFTLIGIVVMMLLISPLLALVALLAVPAVLVMTRFIARRSQPQFIRQWSRTGKLNGEIEEAFTGHALVKVFGRQREVEASFEETNAAVYDASFKAQFMSGTVMPLTGFIGNLGYVAVAVLGGVRVTSGAMTLGDVQAVVQYARQLSQPMTQVASMTNVMQSGIASAERIFDMLDAAEESAEPTGVTLPPLHGRVEFDDVSFSYSSDQPLIEHLSLVAEPGQTVAIVGPTGAGKTTLVNLIMRFYDLDRGRILLDGVDIATVPRQQVRGQIGMVLQDAWLFGGTIRDNIAYGAGHDGRVTDDDIRRAAEVTFVDRFVHSLPDGYDTVVADEGGNLSVGERQLITIARAFLADPPILILDEATSSVDTRTELLLQQAMSALRTNRTSFVIAHRLSTIRSADRIVVVEEGRIVEQGNHDELIAAAGAYHRLYQAQFRAPVEA